MAGLNSWSSKNAHGRVQIDWVVCQSRWLETLELLGTRKWFGVRITLLVENWMLSVAGVIKPPHYATLHLGTAPHCAIVRSTVVSTMTFRCF